MTEPNEIQIGKYLLREMTSYDGMQAIWIMHESGEGMQTSIEKLEAAIDEYYSREF
jgi:hypothetical protein